MADAREESSEDSSESSSIDNFSIYVETSSSEEDLQNVEEPRTSTSSAATHNSRKAKSKSSSKYNPSVPNLKHILMEKWHLIESQPKLRGMFKEPPIISYKRGISLKDVLVRAKL